VQIISQGRPTIARPAGAGARVVVGHVDLSERVVDLSISPTDSRQGRCLESSIDLPGPDSTRSTGADDGGTNAVAMAKDESKCRPDETAGVMIETMQCVDAFDEGPLTR